MANDYPDYLSPAGRNIEGGSMTSYIFDIEVASDDYGIVMLPAVPAGCENIYQCLTISCLDDSAIHWVMLIRWSDGWDFFVVSFVTGGIFDFPGQAIAAGEQVALIVTNDSAGTLGFSGAVNYVTRAV